MTDTDLLLARFDAVVARLETMAGVTPLVYAIPPVHVAAGELIESAWGNSVVDTFAVQATHSSYNNTDTITAGPLIQTRSQVLTTTAGGDITCGFRYPYASSLVGVVGWGVEPALAHIFTLRSVSTTSFVANVRNVVDGSIAASATVAISYIAIGPRL